MPSEHCCSPHSTRGSHSHDMATNARSSVSHKECETTTQYTREENSKCAMLSVVSSIRFPFLLLLRLQNSARLCAVACWWFLEFKSVLRDGCSGCRTVLHSTQLSFYIYIVSERFPVVSRWLVSYETVLHVAAVWCCLRERARERSLFSFNLG